MLISERKNNIKIVLVISALCLYFCNIKAINIYVKDALFLCYSTVIPSLFIFMVLATFLSGLKGVELLSLPFTALFRLLNIHNRKIISYCILSILGGFAAGGYFIDKIQKEYDCSENMIGVISIITSINSPAFVISAVGANMLGHISSGIILYFSILLSSFITAFIFSFIFPYSPLQCKKTDIIAADSFICAVSSSVTSIINICGIVILSYTACNVIMLYSQNILISSLFSVFTEVTTACRFIIEAFGKNLYMLCIALSFCPLSTCLQLKNCTENSLNLKILLLSKFVHIPLSLLILRLAVNLFPQSFAVYASGDISVNMYWNAPHISCVMLLISLCFVICFDKKIGVFTILRK